MTTQRARILVIEDEPRIAQFLVKGLGRDGQEVVVAEDGEVGLFLVEQEAFDAVVLDLTLPRRSGLEVLQDVRQSQPTLPVIMLTGHDDPRARALCLEAGASGFLAKPLVFEDLRIEVNTHLEGLGPLGVAVFRGGREVPVVAGSGPLPLSCC